MVFKISIEYINLFQILLEQGISTKPITIIRLVHQYSPVLKKKIRKYLRKCNYSWMVDKTYIKVNNKWNFLYRSINSNCDTIDFYLNKHKYFKTDRKFFRKTLKSSNSWFLKVITVDKNLTYIKAITSLNSKKDKWKYFFKAN